MRVLTVQQPAASLLIAGETSILTHGWPAPLDLLDTAIVIHAGMSRPRPTKWNLDTQEAVVRLGGSLPVGAALGACYLIDTCEILEGPGDNGEASAMSLGSGRIISLRADPFGSYEPGRWAWMVSGQRPYSIPYSVRGREGVWNLPRDLAKAIRRAESINAVR